MHTSYVALAIQKMARLNWKHCISWASAPISSILAMQLQYKFFIIFCCSNLISVMPYADIYRPSCMVWYYGIPVMNENPVMVHAITEPWSTCRNALLKLYPIVKCWKKSTRWVIKTFQRMDKNVGITTVEKAETRLFQLTKHISYNCRRTYVGC